MLYGKLFKYDRLAVLGYSKHVLIHCTSASGQLDSVIRVRSQLQKMQHNSSQKWPTLGWFGDSTESGPSTVPSSHQGSPRHSSMNHPSPGPLVHQTYLPTTNNFTQIHASRDCSKQTIISAMNSDWLEPAFKINHLNRRQTAIWTAINAHFKIKDQETKLPTAASMHTLNPARLISILGVLGSTNQDKDKTNHQKKTD